MDDNSAELNKFCFLNSSKDESFYSLIIYS